jgi:hypothetical protein
MATCFQHALDPPDCRGKVGGQARRRRFDLGNQHVLAPFERVQRTLKASMVAY